MSENGITSAADYRRASESYHGLQRVTLPSGAVFLLRRPSLAYRLTHLASYQSVAARASDPGFGTRDSGLGIGEQQKLVEFYYAVVCEVCVSPRVSLDAPRGSGLGTRDSGEVTAIHPEDIQARDAFFIARWAGGEISADGADLAEFRKQQSGPDPAARASSADVELPAEPTARDSGLGARDRNYLQFPSTSLRAGRTVSGQNQHCLPAGSNGTPSLNSAELALQIDIACAVALWRWQEEQLAKRLNG